MSTKLPGYDKTVVCPYNKCHVILKSRIQTHLVKCEKQHPEIKLETCPFDITHRYRPEDKLVMHSIWSLILYWKLSNVIHCFVLVFICFLLQKLHLEQCTSRDNFDRYVLSVGNNQRDGASQANQSQSKPSTYSKPKIENNDDDWSD